MNKRRSRRSETWTYREADTLMAVIVGAFIYMLAVMLYVL